MDSTGEFGLDPCCGRWSDWVSSGRSERRAGCCSEGLSGGRSMRCCDCCCETGSEGCTRGRSGWEISPYRPGNSVRGQTKSDVRCQKLEVRIAEGAEGEGLSGVVDEGRLTVEERLVETSLAHPCADSAHTISGGRTVPDHNSAVGWSAHGPPGGPPPPKQRPMLQVMQPPVLVRENRREQRIKQQPEQRLERLREQRAVQRRKQLPMQLRIQLPTRPPTRRATRPTMHLPVLRPVLRHMLRETQLRLQRDVAGRDFATKADKLE